MSYFKRALEALICVSLMTASSQPLSAEEQSREPGKGSISQDYCENFSNIVADLRVQRQKEELLELEKELDVKLKEVLARTEDLKAMIRKRDEMLELASNELLKIYSRMDPESAARQLEKIQTSTAASILRRLKPQLASEILATMDVKRASVLVQIIANQNADIEQEKHS
ncbi:MAG: MotE family protein [Aestuariivirga sp.]